MVGALAIGAVAAAPLNAVLVVAVFALGEEIGWRGFLLPALRPLGPVPALVLTGAIWGFWHTPIILLGHNFGLFDMRGVALMIVGCVLVGIVFGWSRLRTGSVWPAVFGHAGLNAGSSALLALRSADDPENLVFVNPLGIAGWIITLAVIIVLIITKQFDREGRLGYSRRQLEKLTPQPAAETGGADQVRLSQNDQTDQD
jgi:membrane protease YdiL (CAAX protease family)